MSSCSRTSRLTRSAVEALTSRLACRRPHQPAVPESRVCAALRPGRQRGLQLRRQPLDPTDHQCALPTRQNNPVPCIAAPHHILSSHLAHERCKDGPVHMLLFQGARHCPQTMVSIRSQALCWCWLQKAGGPAPVKQVQLRGSDSSGNWEILNNLWGAGAAVAQTPLQ